MPTYAYACTACDHRFEIQQSFTDDALTECPQCAGRIRKLFNAVGIVFKGSGFYRTDSRNSTKAAGSGPAKDGAKEAAGAVTAAAGGAGVKAPGSSGSGSSGNGSGSGSKGSTGSGASKSAAASTSAA